MKKIKSMKNMNTLPKRTTRGLNLGNANYNTRTMSPRHKPVKPRKKSQQKMVKVIRKIIAGATETVKQSLASI